MKTKILVIAVVKNDNQVLLRKKPKNNPYKESWYLFGDTLDSDNTNPAEVIEKALEKQAGIKIKFNKALTWDIEIKPDQDGEETFFIYLDCLCDYVSGELTLSEGIEKLEWVEIEKLKQYGLVPPTKKLFEKLGYL